MNLDLDADTLYLALINFVLIGILGWYIRKRIATRLDQRGAEQIEKLKADLHRQNEIALVELKDDLEKTSLLHASAHASFAAAQEAAIERRLRCAETLWNELLRFRHSLPGILTIMDLLTEEEYPNILEKPTAREYYQNLSMDGVLNLYETDTEEFIEDVRPFVDEYLWQLFTRYRAIQARILLHLVWFRDQGSDIYWYRNPYTRQLIADTLSSEELTTFDRRRIGKIRYIREAIEIKVLNELRGMISGERSGSESFRQARRLRSLAREELLKPPD